MRWLVEVDLGAGEGRGGEILFESRGNDLDIWWFGIEDMSDVIIVGGILKIKCTATP